MIYQLWVYCRRNDVSCDAGLHASREVSDKPCEQPEYPKRCKDEQQALAELRQAARELQRMYDEVFCTVKDGDGNEIERYTLRTHSAATHSISYKLSNWNN